MARAKKTKNERDKDNPPAESQEKKGSPMDRIFWPLVALAAVFFLGEFLRPRLSSPWFEVLAAVQILCPVAAAYLLIRAYPHPLRTLQRKLAAERANYERTSKQKKKKKRLY